MEMGGWQCVFELFNLLKTDGYFGVNIGIDAYVTAISSGASDLDDHAYQLGSSA
jgi:hypothetical protein